MKGTLGCPKCGSTPFIRQIGVPGFPGTLAVCPYCGYQEEDGKELRPGDPELQKPFPPEDKPTQVNVTISFDKADIDSVVRQVIERLKEEGIRQGR